MPHNKLLSVIGFTGDGEAVKAILAGTYEFPPGTDPWTRKHPGHWCNGLVLHLLQITHRQWTYCCQTVHYEGADGLTEEQQHKIMRDFEDLLRTDPSILLPEDRSLLCVDFESLGNSPAIMRQLWISEMEATTAAARLESAQQEDVIWENDQPEVPIDTEGSIWFRQRCKRSNR
jgi:hypothetical protein